MYHNRLRVDELCDLFQCAGLRVLCADAWTNPDSLRRLREQEFALDRRFKDKSPETNATEKVWITAAPS
jgi:hypothetical protein